MDDPSSEHGQPDRARGCIERCPGRGAEGSRPGLDRNYVTPFARGQGAGVPVEAERPGRTDGRQLERRVRFESRQPVTVVSPGPSTRGTIQPSSCFE